MRVVNRPPSSVSRLKFNFSRIFFAISITCSLRRKFNQTDSDGTFISFYFYLLDKYGIKKGISIAFTLLFWKSLYCNALRAEGKGFFINSVIQWILALLSVLIKE